MAQIRLTVCAAAYCFPPGKQLLRNSAEIKSQFLGQYRQKYFSPYVYAHYMVPNVASVAIFLI